MLQPGYILSPASLELRFGTSAGAGAGADPAGPTAAGDAPSSLRSISESPAASTAGFWFVNPACAAGDFTFCRLASRLFSNRLYLSINIAFHYFMYS